MGSANTRNFEALRAELNRLRNENSRLSRLLELKGDETAPSPQQSAAPLDHPGLVTMASPIEAKLALYQNLFRCRTDVYAIQWPRKTGRPGWGPANEGGWRARVERRPLHYLPLTDRVLAAHLKGDIFIGLYPLMKDSTCHFVAADFDGPTSMLDALAYIKAARAAGVPVALEVSQSGRGAHAWIFFSGAVAATMARALAEALLGEAMRLRGTMDLRAYDRLFPSQDVLPDAGFGSLIAAPLQGQRRADGLTTFLDLATLEPYADQWEFLSTLDRASPAAAARLARKLSAPTTGREVGVVQPSVSTKVQPRLPAVIHAELGASLVIDATELSPAASAAFKHAASIANPAFYELQRLRKSTWNTPRFVRGYDVTLEGDLVLPRGLRERITAMIEQHGSRLSINDIRETGDEIESDLRAQLTEAQENSVSALLAHDDGVLVAPPGSGKTVMACALIAERRTSTLILVDRKMLAEQWRERLQQFLGLKAGQYGGGRRKMTGVVDIAMLPSLARRDDIGEFTSRYGHIVVDECHHVAAAAYDHSMKRISARYWLGLTATPSRRDRLDEIINWQLGPIRHTMGDEESHETLFAHAADTAGPRRILTIHETGFTTDDIDPSAPAWIAEVHARLAADGARNQQIADDVVRESRKGRNSLVLTRRVAHLTALAALLREREIEPLILQGGLTTTQRRAVMEQLDELSAGDGVVLLGTAPLVGEGFDVPALDTLFLAAPISFDGLLVQCAGRVVRPSPGKTLAEVHDYHDVGSPVLAASLTRRMKGYRKLGFEKA